nr:LOW QUALITY PROTEIN: 1-aminocyclopropane-1-carboxylate oxidase homolog 12 [Aegilops tauschii subsp. strangulata]
MASVVVDYNQPDMEIKAFHGVTKLPSMFIHPPEDLLSSSLPEPEEDASAIRSLHFPVIDLTGLRFDSSECRKEMVEEIRNAAESWGFFQLVNHGIPLGVMEGIQRGVRAFHELSAQEDKAKWYSRDFARKVNLFSFHGDLNETTPADWRDTLSCKVLQDPQSFEAIPQICRSSLHYTPSVPQYFFNYFSTEVEGAFVYNRDKIIFFGNIVKVYREEVKEYMSELFSEALGLGSDYLASTSTRCFSARSMACHYFPICPQPHLTMGGTKHADLGFLTLLLQDSVGGLQVLHQDVWIDVPPVKGALLANIADMMQIITNGKFKSVEHRVLLRPTVEPRISIACFLSADDLDRPYGPIKELLSEDNKPIYDQVIFREYMKKYKL